MTYRVLITGSRSWCRASVIEKALNKLHAEHEDLVIVHGACPRGADAMADAWADLADVPVERYRADWDLYGRSAGHRRNAIMVGTKPDLVLAFILRNSPGATGCVKLAEKAGIPVRKWLVDFCGGRIREEHSG